MMGKVFEYDGLTGHGVSREPTAAEFAEQKAREEEWAAGEVNRQFQHAQMSRQAAFRDEADPLFFKYQAGEATREQWESVREEIRQRFPYPEGV
jgi:hypothetical protein